MQGNKALALTVLHVIAVIVSVLTAISAVGADKLAGLFSHNPADIMTSAISLLVAVMAAIGAGGSTSFLKK